MPFSVLRSPLYYLFLFREKTSPDEEMKPESMDYPRPDPTTGDAHHDPDHVHNHYEEEGPHKREKNSEKKVQEYAHWKSETTRPTRDLNVGQKGQNLRISQPAGKGLNV